MPVFAVRYHYQADSDEQKNEIRPSHREWLGRQHAAGLLLASGPLVGVNGALLIWEYDDADALSGLLQHDPFAVHNLIEQTEIIEWTNFFGPWAS